jgi:hypothetical protein
MRKDRGGSGTTAHPKSGMAMCLASWEAQIAQAIELSQPARAGAYCMGINAFRSLIVLAGASNTVLPWTMTSP